MFYPLGTESFSVHFCVKFPFPVLSRDLDLYLIHVADLSPGKLGAAKDVLGEGTLATSFP